MKCLSVCQPFADLITSGRKKIELRNWNTKFRGEFLVHAPQKIREEDARRLGISGSVTGAIVGKAEIFGVKKYENASECRRDRMLHHASGDFDTCRYGFMLRNAKMLRVPIPYRGGLGFFEVDLPKANRSEIVADIVDEEHRYRLVGHH